MVDRVVTVVRYPGGRTSVLRGTQEQILSVLEGQPGPAGPPGPPGAGFTYFTYVQSTPSSSWLIPHNLGRNPSVTIVVAGQMILTDVEYPDLNNVLVIWPAPTLGSAYLS